MLGLRNKTALITGGTQGVGGAIACSLAEQGVDLILHGREENRFAVETIERCRRFGVDVTPLYVDLDQPIESVIDLFEKGINIGDRIPELLVNNAGIYIDVPFEQMTPQLFQKTFHVNVQVGYFLTQWFSRRWSAESIDGRVLFTGSINGVLSESDHSSYDASKGAVAALVRSLCTALAPLGIRINSIAPGLVRTPLTNQILDRDPSALEWMKLHTPNGQVPGAEVCGPIAAFLLSDLATHIHGQTIYVDGGMSVWQQPELPTRFRTD